MSVLTRIVKSMVPQRYWGAAARLWFGDLLIRRRFQREHLGAGSYIDPSVRIVGADNVRIGRSTTISEDTWLNVNHRQQGSVRIRIGDSCHVGRGNFWSSGPLIAAGDYFFSGEDCRLLGCGHCIDVPGMPYVAARLTEGAPIVIEANCWLTTAVTVLEGVTIGRGSVIGAASLVSRSIPPFCLAVGNPCVPVRQFSFRDNMWIPAVAYRESDDAFAPDEASYLELLRHSAGDLSPSILSTGRRFGWL